MKHLIAALAALGILAAAYPAMAQDADKGKEIYQTVCSACHGPDPSQDGPLGPAITGSSKELLEARVLRAEYPPGYDPKRDTNLMPPFPQYEENIGDIHAFLNQ